MKAGTWLAAATREAREEPGTHRIACSKADWKSPMHGRFPALSVRKISSLTTSLSCAGSSGFQPTSDGVLHEKVLRRPRHRSATTGTWSEKPPRLWIGAPMPSSLYVRMKSICEVDPQAFLRNVQQPSSPSAKVFAALRLCFARKRRNSEHLSFGSAVEQQGPTKGASGASLL